MLSDNRIGLEGEGGGGEEDESKWKCMLGFSDEEIGGNVSHACNSNGQLATRLEKEEKLGRAANAELGGCTGKSRENARKEKASAATQHEK